MASFILGQFYNDTDTTHSGIPIVSRKNKKYYNLTGLHIVKLSYCCEPKGRGHSPNNNLGYTIGHADYPIYILYSNGTEVEIEIGKTGIYEIAVDDEEIIKNSTIYISGVKVPKDIKYTLDYVTEV